jgi:hypothetical protein
MSTDIAGNWPDQHIWGATCQVQQEHSMLKPQTACQLGFLIAALSSMLYPAITTVAALTALFTHDPTRRRIAQQILKTLLACKARPGCRHQQPRSNRRPGA